MTFNLISYIGISYFENIGRQTVLDKVIEYQGKQVLIQVNEFDSNVIGSERVRRVDVYYLIGKLYGSSSTNNPRMSKVDFVKDPFDQDVLERLISNRLDVRGEIFFKG